MRIREILEKLVNEKEKLEEYLKTNNLEEGKTNFDEYETNFIKNKEIEDKIKIINKITYELLTKRVGFRESMIKIIDSEIESKINSGVSSLEELESFINEKVEKEIRRIKQEELVVLNQNQEALNKAIEDFKKDHKKFIEELEDDFFNNKVNSMSLLNPLFLVDSVEIDEETEKEAIKRIEEAIKNDTRVIVLHEVKKERIEELKKENLDNKSLIEELDYINNNILVDIDDNDIDYYKTLSENLGHIIQKDTNKEVYENIVSNLTFKESFYLASDGIVKTNNNFKENQEAIIEDINSKEFKIGDKNKEYLIEALEMLDSMKDFDGNSLLDLKTYSQEETSKVYAFKNFIDVRKRIETAIDSGKKEDLDRLGDLIKFNDKSFEMMDQLIEKVKHIDMDRFPSNISVSRNKFMPPKYVKDYLNVSKVNGLWHTLALIKKSGISIKEYVNDPTSVYKGFINKFKGFSEFNEVANKMGVLNVIKTLTIDDKFTNMSEFDTMPTKIIKKTDTMRFFEFTGIVDKENKVNNKTLSTLFNETINTKLAAAQTDMSNEYFKDNRIETVMNMLVQEDPKRIDYASISMSSTLPVDPVTGKKNKVFNYNEFIVNGEYNLDKLNQNLTNYKNKVDDIDENPEYEGIKDLVDEAVKRISKDIILKKNIELENSFEDYLEKSEMSFKNYIKETKGRNTVFYANARIALLNLDSNTNKDNLKNALIALKGLNESYSSKGFLRKYLTITGYKERHALTDIKASLQNKGLDINEIENSLNGTKKLSEVTKEANLVNHNRETYRVNMAEKYNYKPEINKNTNIDKDKKHEKEIEKDEIKITINDLTKKK